ncbi:MAG: hypothetical protein HW392_2123 [Steroidobacteraceae bacterium]|nr:hypothetical protein [Steroidobacteraceae bacterium]
MQTKSSIPESEANGQSAAATVDRAPSGVSGEFQNFIADVEDLIKATTSLTGEDLARAKTNLSERVAAARKSVEGIGGEIADQARDAVKTTNSYVHEHPWQAVGIGAALGLLLGVTLARRK